MTFFCANCKHASTYHENTLLGSICHGTTVGDDRIARACDCEALREDETQRDVPDWVTGRRA